MHVDDQVTRKKFPRRLAFLAFFDFRDTLGWDEDLVNQVDHFLGLDAFQDVLAHLVLLSGQNVHDVPLIFACKCLCHNQCNRVKKWTKFTRTKSNSATYPPSSNMAMATTSVESVSSLYRRNPFSFGSQGQEAFCSSTFTSPRKFFTLVIISKS